MRRNGVRVRSYLEPARLLPRRERGLRAGSVLLMPGRAMDWHSTERREELLIMLIGRVDLELRVSPRSARRRVLNAGQCAFLPKGTLHRVMNRSRTTARYLYVTGSADGASAR